MLDRGQEVEAWSGVFNQSPRLMATTRLSLSRLELFALIDGLESVHIENQTPEQLAMHDALIPKLEAALDRIDSKECAEKIAALVFS